MRQSNPENLFAQTSNELYKQLLKLEAKGYKCYMSISSNFDWGVWGYVEAGNTVLAIYQQDSVVGFVIDYHYKPSKISGSACKIVSGLYDLDDLDINAAINSGKCHAAMYRAHEYASPAEAVATQFKSESFRRVSELNY